MKKLILLFCFLFFTLNHSFSQGVWTWMSGDSSLLYAGGGGGKIGVPSVHYYPAPVVNPYCWTDLEGNFWLYGGSDDATIYSDLWKFNPSTLEWTLVKVTGEVNLQSDTAIRGQMGVAAPNNTPGSRTGAGCTWVGKNGDLWLFSGGAAGSSKSLGDLWKYNIVSNDWTWMSGSDSVNYPFPVYGVMGVPSLSNQPGFRQGIGKSWVDENGQFWLYGGLGDALRYRSDMWMYNPDTNMWTWESGSQGTISKPVYAGKGVFSDVNTPAGRWPLTMIVKDNGNFLLFGGQGSDAGAYADLWEYNPTINQWALLNGAPYLYAAGVEGAACESDSTYYPDSRFGNAAPWKDCAGNLWLYGGSLSANYNLTVGDIWVYLVATKKWARISNSSNTNMLPAFGAFGIPSSSNNPGARYGSASWKDKNGNFWIFGGADYHYSYPYDDMWCYVPNYSCINANCGCAQLAGKDTSFNYTINGEQVIFSPASNPSNIVLYGWSFGDNQTSNEVNPVHTFDSKMNYKTCLSEYTDSGCFYTFCKQINLLDNGVEKVSPNQSIRLYPNPANDELTIEVLNGNTPKQITITDDLGQPLIQLTTYKTKTQIDIHALAAGIYFVKTQLADGSVAVNKLVKE